MSETRIRTFEDLECWKACRELGRGFSQIGAETNILKNLKNQR